jgi:hypothetical protein
METLEEKSNEVTTQPELSRRIGLIRLVIGLTQGLILYWLYRSVETVQWPATDAYSLTVLLIVALFIPILFILGIGDLTRKQLGMWIAGAVLICVFLALYDVWRAVGSPPSEWRDPNRNPSLAELPSFTLFLFPAVGLFITHVLVTAGCKDRRYLARYETYFGIAWKQAVRLTLALVFSGLGWLILLLGSELFDLAGLTYMAKLVYKEWFSIPVTLVMVSGAIHLTDVKPAILSAIRHLLLTLLSFLLPLAVLLIAIFLASLPFQGFSKLWSTNFATGILLAASAGLVVLINAALQDHESTTQISVLPRHSARLACLLILPLVVIGCYALGLRVQIYGWTTERIIAAACLGIAMTYAVGYAVATLRHHRWLGLVARVNVFVSFLVLAVILALFSPLMDPARISVANQVARLQNGQVAAKDFDFEYLRFEGKRYGQVALAELQRTPPTQEAEFIKAAAAKAASETDVPWDFGNGKAARADDVKANIQVKTLAATLPDSFYRQDWSQEEFRFKGPQCLHRAKTPCTAYTVDFDTEHGDEILLIDQQPNAIPTVFKMTQDGQWRALAELPDDFAQCSHQLDQLAAGNFKRVETSVKTLNIGGQLIEPRVLDVESRYQCQ